MQPVIPDHLPHEPRRERLFGPLFGLALVGVALLAVASGVLSALLLPLFALGWARFGYPPHVPQLPTAAHHLRLCITEPSSGPGRTIDRVWIALRLAQRVLSVPIWGVAWYLDEVLFGQRLDARSVDQPLFLLSAARSGSTQLAHYLEDDPGLVAPVALQFAFPYLWAWIIAVPTLGWFFTYRRLGALFDWAVPLEMKQRHEGHPLQTDTLEVIWLWSMTHTLAARISPRVLGGELVFMGTAPHNRTLWDDTFVRFVDRLGRKTLLYGTADGEASPPRLFIKGHFLESRDALYTHFPTAQFLTMVRDPVRRIESMLNHMHGNPVEEALGATPWSWLVPAYVATEKQYCQTEQAWYSAPSPRRTVVRFQDYVADLEGTMQLVYRACLDVDTVPPHVPREHAPRKRTNYVVHRSLEDLHVDRAALAAELEDYRGWCAGP